MYIIIIKIKNHQKLIHHFLKFKKYYFLRKYNCISKIFFKIYLKFYSNVAIHNQTYEL